MVPEGFHGPGSSPSHGTTSLSRWLTGMPYTKGIPGMFSASASIGGNSILSGLSGPQTFYHAIWGCACPATLLHPPCILYYSSMLHCIAMRSYVPSQRPLLCMLCAVLH